MKKIILLLLVFLCVDAVAQTVHELSEQALEWARKDSLQQAEETYRQALRLEPANPHNALLFSNIGALQMRMGRPVEAIDSYTMALNIAPQVVSILLDRAAAYMEAGLTDRAYGDYCRVLDLDSDNHEAIRMRAHIYTSKRDYKSARVEYNRLLEFEPLSYSGRLGLIIVNQKEAKHKEALEIINKMLAESPQDATLYIVRAEIQQEMGLSDFSLIDLNEAIRLNPTSIEAHLVRGEVYLSQKKKSLAKADFEKSLALGASAAEIREYLQQCK